MVGPLRRAVFDEPAVTEPALCALVARGPRAGEFGEQTELGIRVASGANAGERSVTTDPDGVAIQPGRVGRLPVVIEFDPASLVVTAYGRLDAGTTLANRFLGGFFRI